MNKAGPRRLVRTTLAIALAWLGWTLVAPPLPSTPVLGIAPGACHQLGGPSLLLSRRARYSVVVERELPGQEMAIDGGDDDPELLKGLVAHPDGWFPLPSALRPMAEAHHAAPPAASHLRC